MMKRAISFVLTLCIFVVPSFAQGKMRASSASTTSSSPNTTDSQALPITTKSAAARKSYDEAMILAENLRSSEALEKFRAALKQDPKFALAWAQIDRLTRDPKEEAMARQKAKSLADSVSKGEQLLIKWVTGLNEHDSVGAIAAMNDLHASYPNDPRLGFMFGQWLVVQHSYDRAIQVLEDTIKANPKYAAAYNELGYAYSESGNHMKGIATMKKYVDLLPNEPNPHDSYAELNRLAGRYDEAIKHYQQALNILPSFTSSQLGIADTYALMGLHARARTEYDKAIAEESGRREKLEYGFQRAMTYIREKDFTGANQSFLELANAADQAGFPDIEAECHRALASISHDQVVALKHIEAAEAALNHKHQETQAVLQNELARILRSKAIIAEYAGNSALSQSALKQLETMATASRDETIESSYHGAKGGVLFAQKQYAEAAVELAEDSDNALSQSRLAQALAKSGKVAEAQAVRDRLLKQHRVLLEDALVRL